MITSLSGSVMAAQPRSITAGVYKVVTVNHDRFILDYNRKLVTKNAEDADSVVNLEDEVRAGKITGRTASNRLRKLYKWTYGFNFASVCEVGKEAYFILGTGVIGTSMFTDEVASIEQIA